jgi:predicted N-formylglutamate amidohydrolase
MTITDEGRSEARAALLGPGEPPPYRWFNRGGRARLVLVCDHASYLVPRKLAALGLSRASLRSHIGWDIGAAWVTEHLARLLDAPALLAGYSRLVIDCNRYPGDPSSIPACVGGVAVPGNQGLDGAAAEARAEAIFHPYQAALAEALLTRLGRGAAPALVSVHSMVAELAGGARPWHIGLHWAHDQRLAAPVKEILERSGHIVVGDNEPYRLEPGKDYTLPEQAMRRGLAHLQVELRQDLIEGEGGARRWAEVLAAALRGPLADPGVQRVERY